MADVCASERPGFRSGNPLLLTFVLALALELALKSVLRKDGATQKKLIKLGHDVEKIHRLVRKAYPHPRLARTASRARVLKLLRHYYAGKYLEYTPVGVYEVPKPYVLRGMVHEAIRFGVDHVLGAGTYQKLRKARGVRIGAAKPAYGNASQHQMRKRERLLFDGLARGDIASSHFK